jgi:hypothetical protein
VARSWFAGNLPGGSLAEVGGLPFPAGRFVPELDSRAARSLLVCGALPFVCAAPELETRELELFECPLAALDPPVDPWLPIEFEPPELWLLPELVDDDDEELEPPEEPLCEPPELDELLELAELLEELVDEELAELPELAPAAPADECCAKRLETKSVTTMTRPESLIQHLLTDSGEPGQIFVVLVQSDVTGRHKGTAKRVNEHSN